LRRYESKEIKALNLQSKSISEYSVVVHQVYKLPIKNHIQLKEELWIHFDNLIRPVFPNAQVFDVQVALNDTKYLDLLEVLRNANYELKLAEKAAEKKAEKDREKALKKYKKKVDEAQEKVRAYKTTFQNAHPVKAFVTFSSIEAADYIKRVYSACCCRSCITSYKKF